MSDKVKGCFGLNLIRCLSFVEPLFDRLFELLLSLYLIRCLNFVEPLFEPGKLQVIILGPLASEALSTEHSSTEDQRETKLSRFKVK